MNIIVLNLPREMKKEGVAELFSPFGSIDSCELVLDKETGASKVFGFVDMPDPSEANAAIAALHGKKIGQHKIRVKISK